eukprot:11594770-Ditylum_brightwellii.AAC.1
MPSISVNHAESTSINNRQPWAGDNCSMSVCQKCGPIYKTSTFATLNFLQDTPMAHRWPNRLSN